MANGEENANDANEIKKKGYNRMRETSRMSHHAMEAGWCQALTWNRSDVVTTGDDTGWEGQRRLMRRMRTGVWDGTGTHDPCGHLKGWRRHYLQCGEGAGQSARGPYTPPLLLQSSSQTLKLHLLLTHGGQERRGILTLLHTHWERRESITHSHTPAHLTFTWRDTYFDFYCIL